MKPTLIQIFEGRPLLVSPALPSDGDAVEEIGRRVFDCYSAAAMRQAVVEHGGDRDDGILLDPNSHSVTATYLVARRPDSITGSILGIIGVYRLRWIGPHVAYLGWFAVEPNEQRAGIGTSLLKFLVDQISVSGIRHLMVETDSESTSAIHFYERSGFTLSAEISDYWANGATLRLYRKSIVPPT